MCDYFYLQEISHNLGICYIYTKDFRSVRFRLFSHIFVNIYHITVVVQYFLYLIDCMEDSRFSRDKTAFYLIYLSEFEWHVLSCCVKHVLSVSTGRRAVKLGITAE